jgi:hypothetical protein
MATHGRKAKFWKIKNLFLRGGQFGIIKWIWRGAKLCALKTIIA